MNESDLNRLLQQALAPKEFPSDQLNQTIRNRVQESAARAAAFPLIK